MTSAYRRSSNFRKVDLLYLPKRRRTVLRRLLYSSILCSATLEATTRSDIVIVLSKELNSYLYQERISCEDSTCIYTPSFQESPLWISEESGKGLVKTDKIYRLVNTSLSIIYKIPLKKATESPSETRLIFALSNLRVLGSQRDAVFKRSTWVLPEGTHVTHFKSASVTDNWLNLGDVLILETENPSILQARTDIEISFSGTVQSNTTTQPRSTTLPVTTSREFSALEAKPLCTNIIDTITRSGCDTSKSIIFAGVTFKQNSSSLSPKTRHLLDQLIHPLLSNEEKRFEIGAYTDSKGPKRWNLQLSRDRAETIRQYLIFRGIKPSILVSTGYGESHPISDNSSAEGRRLNRRIEIKRLNEE